MSIIIKTLFEIFLECLGLMAWTFGFAVAAIFVGYLGIIALIKLEEEANKTEIIKEAKHWLFDDEES